MSSFLHCEFSVSETPGWFIAVSLNSSQNWHRAVACTFSFSCSTLMAAHYLQMTSFQFQGVFIRIPPLFASHRPDSGLLVFILRLSLGFCIVTGFFTYSILDYHFFLWIRPYSCNYISYYLVAHLPGVQRDILHEGQQNFWCLSNLFKVHYYVVIFRK